MNKAYGYIKSIKNIKIISLFSYVLILVSSTLVKVLINSAIQSNISPETFQNHNITVNAQSQNAHINFVLVNGIKLFSLFLAVYLILFSGISVYFYIKRNKDKHEVTRIIKLSEFTN